MEGEKGLGGKEGGEEIVPSAGASVHLRNKWVLWGRKTFGRFRSWIEIAGLQLLSSNKKYSGYQLCSTVAVGTKMKF